MDFTLTTPALLFPAISLLLLAYTNRFLALAALIRNLKAQYHETADPVIIRQIDNLRKRIYIIRNMQGFGILSFFLCVFCMFLFFNGQMVLAQYVFGVSLVLLMISLVLSFREIQISVGALDFELSTLENSIEQNAEPVGKKRTKKTCAG